MNHLVQLNQSNIMNYNLKIFQLNILKMKKSLLFAFTLICINAIHSQTNINGSFSIFGEMGNFGNLQLSADAQVFFQNGSTLHMLGTATTINSGAEIFANTSSTQAGTGRILFIGAAAQTLDGGNSSAIGGAHPSLINIAIDNINNVTLTNSYARITSGLDFVNGHLILGNQNFEISSSASISNSDENQYVVTNGTGFLAKESIASSASFDFPVGRATTDYTPATITPNSTDNFFVQVKNYSESASDENIVTDGIDRTWNIYSTSGSAANLTLQHNTSTNGSAYTSDADAFVTQYQGSSMWDDGVGATGTNTASTGTSLSAVKHTRLYTTVTSASANGAFYSKSTNLLTPLPVTLIDFNAQAASHLVSQITWTTTNEFNNSHFILETSVDRTNWTKIGEVKGAGTSSQVNHYAFKHVNAQLGVNFYRVTMVDFEGNTSQTDIRLVEFSNGLNPVVKIYPNPSQGIINIISENSEITYTLTSFDGKLILSNDSKQSGLQSIDLNHLDNAMYFLNVTSNYQTKTYKIILNK